MARIAERSKTSPRQSNKTILKRLIHLEAEVSGLKEKMNKFLPEEKELTEEDVLKIIEEGERELREGKAKVLHSLKDLR